VRFYISQLYSSVLSARGNDWWFLLVFIIDDADMTAVALSRGCHYKLVGDDTLSQRRL